MLPTLGGYSDNFTGELGYMHGTFITGSKKTAHTCVTLLLWILHMLSRVCVCD